jgi:mono/diheme cytochrome c family protein
MKENILKSLVVLGVLAFTSCGGEAPKTNESADASASAPVENSDPSSYDPKRGEGKYNESNVSIGALDNALATGGEAIANTKCTSCHKTTDEKLVGPGWKGVTERRSPFWIMNFITNPDPMIDKDPEVQAQLELCLVRMPNQNLGDDEARQVLEYLRKNDGAK